MAKAVVPPPPPIIRPMPSAPWPKTWSSYGAPWISAFLVAGHDRGGRVAYRVALDHPDGSRGSPSSTFCRWRRRGGAPMRGLHLAIGHRRCWPNPNRFRNGMVVAAVETVVDNALGGWGSRQRRFQRRSAPNMSRRCAIPITLMRFARSIGRPHRSIARTTGRIATADAESACLLALWSARDRSTVGMPDGPLGSGAIGPLTCGATRSTADIFSRRKRRSRLRPRWAGFFPVQE